MESVTSACFVIILFLFSKRIGCSPHNKGSRIGTILFTESDNTKDCWSTENIALLTSRMLLEDLLPSRDVLVIRDAGFVNDMVGYFRLVLDVVRKLTSGKAKHIVLLAVTDILGGYLNRFVLPMAKHAYYAGFINFDSMEKLHQLFDELKCFLRTNGHGWVKPVADFGSNKLVPRPLPTQSPTPQANPCKGIIYYEKSSDGSGKNCTMAIPMPFFDSKTMPSAIAVPFKSYSLRNIESKSAAYILVKFYLAAIKCLAAHNVNQKSVADFNANFYSWIHGQVLPRLNDDKFYSAFGGILRVQETLKRAGISRMNGKEMGNYNIMPEMQAKETITGLPEEQCVKKKKTNLIMMAVLVTIFIWFLLGTLFVCYRIRAGKSKKGEPRRKSGPKMGSRSKDQSAASTKGSKSSSKSDYRQSSSSNAPKRSSTSRSRKSTTSSGKMSPGADTSASPYASDHVSPTPGDPPESKQTSSTASVGKSDMRRGSDTSSAYSKPSRTPSQSPQQKEKSVTVYPASCACHTSMTGRYRMTSSSDDFTGKERIPFVFGYELQTTSSECTTPRDQSEEMCGAGGGNMSK